MIGERHVFLPPTRASFRSAVVLTKILVKLFPFFFVIKCFVVTIVSPMFCTLCPFFSCFLMTIIYIYIYMYGSGYDAILLHFFFFYFSLNSTARSKHLFFRFS